MQACVIGGLQSLHFCCHVLMVAPCLSRLFSCVACSPVVHCVARSLPSMAPKKKRPAPLPVGALPSGASSSSGPAADPPPQPSEPIPEEANKRRWHETRKGKKKLARAIEHRNEREFRGDGHLSCDPYLAMELLEPSSSPLADLRTSVKSASALLLYLLQLLTRVLSFWKPPPELAQTSGIGEGTAPRLALLWHRQVKMDDRLAQALTRRGWYIFLRALREGEKVPASVVERLTGGWKQERLESQKHELLLFFRETLVRKTNAGALPNIFGKSKEQATEDFNGEAWGVFAQLVEPLRGKVAKNTFTTYAWDLWCEFVHGRDNWPRVPAGVPRSVRAMVRLAEPSLSEVQVDARVFVEEQFARKIVSSDLSVQQATDWEVLASVSWIGRTFRL